MRQVIDPEIVEKAISSISTSAEVEFFFDNLASPEWIKPLEERGLLSEAPEPEEEDGLIGFPPWPVSRYLARMAQKDPEEVLRVALELRTNGNASVQADLIDAALAMPPNLAAQLASKVAKWLQTPYLLLPHRSAALVSHLAKGEQADAAFEIAREMLAVEPGRSWDEADEGSSDPYLKPEPQSRVQQWDVEEFVKLNLPDLVRIAARRAFDLLSEMLEEFVQLRRVEGEPEYRDISEVWRPSIAPHAQNPTFGGLRDLLVSATREAALEAINQDPDSLREIVAELEQRKWTIFRRIALDVVNEFGEQDQTLVDLKLTNRAIFSDASLRHEYAVLISNYFGQRSASVQDTVYGWIEEGPDLTYYIERIDRDEERQPDEEELENRREYWRLEWYEILRDFLSEELMRSYEVLSAKYGVPQHPDFVSWSSGVMVGPTSPLSNEQIQAMTIDELTEFLRSWLPEEGFMVPSREGLGRAISDVVSEDPQRYSAQAAKLTGFDPTYVRSAIVGFKRASEGGYGLEWEPVLELCRWAASQPRNEMVRDTDDLEEGDPHWGWARMEIARLLDEGLKPKEYQIPPSLKALSWSIIEQIAEDPDPTTESEDRQEKSPMDAAARSINSVRGTALHAAFRFVFWCRQNSDQLWPDSEDSAFNLDRIPEAKELLERHLQLEQDKSQAVRSVYGWWILSMIQLDRKWIDSHLHDVFPHEEGLRPYWEAAWHTVVRFVPPSKLLLEVLRDEYEIALRQIGSESADDVAREGPEARLAEHILTYYWRGDLDLESDFVQVLWALASLGLRVHALTVLGRALYNTEGRLQDDVIDRLQEFWERLVPTTGPSVAASDELKAFGWWFASGKLDAGWSIAQLETVLKLAKQIDASHLAVQRLASIVDDYPRESVSLLAAMVEGDTQGWGPHLWRENAMQVLKQALSNPDTQTRQSAENLVHRLGARGYLEYGDLLQAE
ncbi:MAG: hypothetical protein ACE5M4_05740 [Anaerolineales bacterium]